MKNRAFFGKVLLLASVVFFIACDNTPKFTIKGNITEADEQTIYLEKRGITGTTLVDSVKVKKDGSFEIKAQAPQYPDLYLIKLGKETINLSVDSIETIEIKGNAKTLSSTYEVAGSEGSLLIKQTIEAYQKLFISVRDLQQKHKDGKIDQNQLAIGVDSALTPYQKEVKRIISTDFKSPAAYFALFQKIDGLLLLDPYSKDDGKMYPAVATAWDTYYKDSDRAKHLYSFTMGILKEKRQQNQQGAIVNPLFEQAQVVDLFDVSLPDINGKEVPLSSLKGKVVLLDFTSYQTEYSPAYNVKLNEVYKQFKGQFEIYQIAFDTDTHLWKNAAVNLPWISVRESQAANSDLLVKYNIQSLPTAFLINKEGGISKRLTSIEDLKSEIQKLL